MPELSPFVSAVGTLIAATGLALVVRGQRLYIRQLRFNSLTSLHDLLIGPDVQRAMRYIFRTDPKALIAPRTEQELEHVELVLRTFDLLGHRLYAGVLPWEETLQTEWITVLSLWPRLEPFVTEMTARRGIPYKRYFCLLVEEAERYKLANYPDVQIKTFAWSFGETENGDHI